MCIKCLYKSFTSFVTCTIFIISSTASFTFCAAVPYLLLLCQTHNTLFLFTRTFAPCGNRCLAKSLPHTAHQCPYCGVELDLQARRWGKQTSSFSPKPMCAKFFLSGRGLMKKCELTSYYTVVNAMNECLTSDLGSVTWHLLLHCCLTFQIQSAAALATVCQRSCRASILYLGYTTQHVPLWVGFDKGQL